MGINMEKPLIYDDERINKVNENLSLIEKIKGLTFGTDAYMLAAFIRNHKYMKAAELGSGTGIISLLCGSRGKFAHITAIEVQKDFYDLSKRNIEYNSMSDIITPLCIDIRAVRVDNIGYELDAVFTNPPYMPKDSGKRNTHNEKFIARHEVYGGIDDFCAAGERLLKYGGAFYCVYRPDRLCDLLYSMRTHKLEPKRMTFICANTSSVPSMVLIEAKKGAAPSLSLTKTLFIYKDAEKGEPKIMTDEALGIYEQCSFT